MSWKLFKSARISYLLMACQSTAAGTSRQRTDSILFMNGEIDKECGVLAFLHLTSCKRWCSGYQFIDDKVPPQLIEMTDIVWSPLFVQSPQCDQALVPLEECSQDITTRHWKPSANCKQCATPECGLQFGLINRCHHCRRCGEVFCAKCISYRKRLSLLANPDPNGKLYKVCKPCFDQGPQTVGQSRSWMTFLKLHRGQGHTGVTATADGINISNFRKKVVLDDECKRLKRGFEQSIVNSGLKRALLSIKDMMSAPDWQKSSFYVYGKMSKVCCYCNRPFSLSVTKRICVICGTAVCSGSDNSCGKSDLLVYVPDGCDKSLPLQAALAIIRIVGCPAKEPKLSLYLVTCPGCHGDLESHQVEGYYKAQAEMENSVSPDDYWSRLIAVDDKLQQMQRKVDDQMPKYQELIEALEVVPSNRGPVSCPTDNKSNMQVLAKSQGDIGDLLTSVSMTVQTLRSAKPQTKPQVTLVKNFIKRWCDYYHENMYLYRSLRRQLEEVTPLEMLTVIQDIVNRNAINCSYLTIHQLALEVLHLVTKYELDDDIIGHMMSVEEVVENDLQMALDTAGESWEGHKECADQLIQLYLKDHRLVRPSRRLTKQLGAIHVREILLERCHYILSQVQLQLDAKCSNHSFKHTKGKVKGTADKVKAMRNANGHMTDGFEILK